MGAAASVDPAKWEGLSDEQRREYEKQFQDLKMKGKQN